MDGDGIIFMKIVDYEIDNTKYSEMLALYTSEDILKYAKENNNFVGDELYRYCNSSCKLKKQLAKLKEEK